MQHLPDGARDGGYRRDGLVAGELDRVRGERGYCRVDVRLRRVREHRHDLRPRPRRRRLPHQCGQPGGFGQREGPRRARDEVQPNGVGAGAEGGKDAVLVGDAAYLDERLPRLRRHVVWHRTRGDERPSRGGRVGRAHQSLADEGSVEPQRPPGNQGSGLAHPRLANHQPVIRNHRSQAQAVLRIHLQGPQVAVVQPDQASVRCQGGLHLALVVRFHQRLQAEFSGQIDEPCEPLARQDRREEQHQIRAGKAKQWELALVDDELLGEDRHVDGGSYCAQVRDGTAEPVRLAENRDGGRSTGLVGARESDGVRVRGDRSDGRRAALDLGDQVQPGCRETFGDGTRGVAGPAG